MRHALVLALALPLPALAAPLLPGSTLPLIDLEAAAVAPGDPDWFGGPDLGASRAGATRAQDGIVDPDPTPIEDLFVLTGRIDSAAQRSLTGRTVFSYGFDIYDTSAGGGGIDGIRLFGFAGYTVDVGWLDLGASPYVPQISRSADGDEILIDLTLGGSFGGPQGAIPAPFETPPPALTDPVIETLLFATDAPFVRTDALGAVGIAIPTFGTDYVTTDPRLVGPSEIPLPAGLPLLALGLAGLVGVRRLT